MKNFTITFFAAIAMMTSAANASAQTSNIQNSNCFVVPQGINVYQLIGMPQSIANTLSLSQAQIDAANAGPYSSYNYYGTRLGVQIEDCDSQINQLIYPNSPIMSTQAAGAQAALLVTQSLNLQSQLTILRQNTTAALLVALKLSPKQLNILQSMINGAQSAQNLVSLVADATYAGLISQPQQVTTNNPPVAIPGIAISQTARDVMQLVRENRTKESKFAK